MTFEEFMESAPETESEWNTAFEQWEMQRQGHYLMIEAQNLVEDVNNIMNLVEGTTEIEARQLALENLVLSIASSLKVEQEISHWHEGVPFPSPKPNLRLVEEEE